MAAPKKSQALTSQLSEDQVRQMQAAGSPFVVAYGMGVDSTAMLIGLWLIGLRPDLILFADLEAEKAETYRYLAIINRWLESVGFPTVTICRYPSQAQTGRSRKIDPRTGVGYENLEGQLLATGRLPGLAYPGSHSCSIKWKGQVQDRHFMRTWAPAIEAWANGRTVIKAMGYDCGAADLKRGGVCAKHEPKLYDWAYCLRWWGWVRDDCKRVILEAGLPVPPKSSCTYCPAMKPDEVRSLATTDPEALLAAIDLEDSAWLHNRFLRRDSIVEAAGLWFKRPNKSVPHSWKAFAESEGLVAQANQALADAAGPTPVDDYLERAAQAPQISPRRTIAATLDKRIAA